MESSKFIWMDGAMVPWEDATVHVLTHALHYGTGVFEGIRAYETRRRDRHLPPARAHGPPASLGQGVWIPLAHSVDDLVEAARQIISVNELESGYIRPLAFHELGAIGLNPAAATVKTIIAAWRWGTYLGDEGVAKGIRVRISSWRRIHQSSFIPIAKGTGQYLNSVMAKQEAVATGYDEAILLNMDGNISEGSGENLFLVRDGVLLTPADLVGNPRRHHPGIGGPTSLG